VFLHRLLAEGSDSDSARDAKRGRDTGSAVDVGVLCCAPDHRLNLPTEAQQGWRILCFQLFEQPITETCDERAFQFVNEAISMLWATPLRNRSEPCPSLELSKDYLPTDKVMGSQAVGHQTGLPNSGSGPSWARAPFCMPPSAYSSALASTGRSLPVTLSSRREPEIWQSVCSSADRQRQAETRTKPRSCMNWSCKPPKPHHSCRPLRVPCRPRASKVHAHEVIGPWQPVRARHFG
jgi:hypothetical protein